jgi:hypothetical protein
VRVCVFLPQPQMAEDAFNDVRFMDDDLHFVVASGTISQLPAFAGTSLFYELPPGLGRHPPRPMVGHIQPRAEEHPEALLGAVAKLCQELSETHFALPKEIKQTTNGRSPRSSGLGGRTPNS